METSFILIAVFPPMLIRPGDSTIVHETQSNLCVGVHNQHWYRMLTLTAAHMIIYATRVHFLEINILQ